MADADTSCRVSIYAPYFIDNRTGFDLVFKDMDVPAAFADLPFLVYNNVRIPGDFDDFCSSTSQPRTHNSPALLNDQTITSFRVADSADRAR